RRREAGADRLGVGADEQAPELVVVRGVGDNGQLNVRRHLANAVREGGATGSAGEHDDRQRNKSSSAGRIRSRPDPLPSRARPRTMTAGVRPVLPITSPALAAISSATASTVAWSGSPASSVVPRRSTRAGK